MRGGTVRRGGGVGLRALVVVVVAAVAAAALVVARADTAAADGGAGQQGDWFVLVVLRRCSCLQPLQLTVRGEIVSVAARASWEWIIGSVNWPVSAINGLYISLGSPKLPGWSGNGGDPCSELWQGVVCTGSSITSVTMNAANLGGQLGGLGNFTSIVTINLSNNKIGGTIPEDLPVTLQHIFLSANQLTGSIPNSLAKLKNLADMSLNDNQLNGQLPDAFGSLTGLVNLDISSNNLTGVLPPSMKNLSSLTTLHMQGNRLSGTLNVLQDLPLKDLNIENNLFSGPVPPKLQSIPNFKKDGNPFNTSIAPSASPPSTPGGPAPTPTPTRPAPSPSPTGPPTPSPTNPNLAPSPPPPSSSAPPPSRTPSNSSDGPTTRDNISSSKKQNSSTLKIVGFVFLGVVLFIVTVLLVIFCLSKYQERRSRYDYNRSQLARVHHTVEHRINPSIVQPREDAKKDQQSLAAVPKKPLESQREHIIDLEHPNNLARTNSELFAVDPPPPPPPPFLSPFPVEKVTVNPVVPPEKRYISPPRINKPTSATSFSVASLQQYTSSFREENLIRKSRLGKVYLAEFPEGKFLEVMKIDNTNGRISVDEFLDLVQLVSDIRHPNIHELVGYCAEYGQRLLVYNHFSTKTLDDALHDREGVDSTLSWNARLQVALGSGKALEYLHESFQPPIVHQNFEPANVLLDNKFSVRVAECGLEKLMASSSVTQLADRMHSLLNYEPPEFRESGIVAEQGDVYSFGVVMLEILTGRKPYDSSLPRAEQHLVRWANSQLHDIESLSKMVDPSIQGQCSEKALSRFADIISGCIREPQFRPPMSEVVQDLARMINETVPSNA
uniref:Protein kinase domain-containing protein n=1 Tax=Oryza meridionalis TaxID=40149 RepID=A0A0E0E4S1_9ORYZ